MSEPITPTRTYYSVFAALIALTLVTVAVSFVELGAWHTTVGVLIGVVKASLVGLFFMHLLHSSKASWLAVLAGLFWLSILMALTLSDYLTRPLLQY
ncbi:MAG TPA: cytochrome C oxidase subunit IV family protein [Gemmataceae bacterium]|nr:cytochrome C oxidase subunit IV family protein [Gemmataceae bacterium]